MRKKIQSEVLNISEKKGIKIWQVAAIVLIAILASSGATWYVVSNSVNPGAKIDKVIFVMDWIMFGKHALFYPALDLGYYEDAGISCTIVRGFGSGDTAKRVDSGSVNFGFADSTSVIQAISKGANIKVIGMIVHEGANGIVTATDTGINSPKDLEGKTLGYATGDSGSILFSAFATANGIDATKVQMTPLDSASKAPMLASGKVDATTNTRPDFAFENALNQAGRQVKYLWYSDNKLSLYGHGIITKSSLIKDNPDLVKRFVDATYKGVQYAIQNQDKAIDMLLKYNPDLNRTTVTAELKWMIEMIGSSANLQGTQIGVIDNGLMTSTINVLTEAMKLSPVAVDNVYTNQFVEG